MDDNIWRKTFKNRLIPQTNLRWGSRWGLLTFAHIKSKSRTKGRGTRKRDCPVTIRELRFVGVQRKGIPGTMPDTWWTKNFRESCLLSGVSLMPGDLDKAKCFARFIQLYMEKEELPDIPEFEKQDSNCTGYWIWHYTSTKDRKLKR